MPVAQMHHTVMEILGRRIGVKKAIMTTVHGYTPSGHLTAHIPHPRAYQVSGRFDGVAVRAPVPVGSS